MDIPVYSFIAKSGTGKTTLIEKLIPELKEPRSAGGGDEARRPRIRRGQAGQGFLAHDPRGSGRHRHRIRHPRRRHGKSPLSRRRSLIEHIRDVDVIITEGYQQCPWKKIGVHRAASGNVLPVTIRQLHRRGHGRRRGRSRAPYRAGRREVSGGFHRIRHVRRRISGFE
jgi:hypothetical protein